MFVQNVIFFNICQLKNILFYLALYKCKRRHYGAGIFRYSAQANAQTNIYRRAQFLPDHKNRITKLWLY